MKKIFISYSHKDEKWKDSVVTHLGVLPNIETWDDRRIGAGADWFEEIKDAINADIAILLVSADFLTSKFILKEEIPRILEFREQGKLIVFPVMVCPCAWKKVAWLSKISIRPKDGEPLSIKNEAQQDFQMAAIAEEVFDLLEKKEPQTNQSQKPNIDGSCFIEIKKVNNLKLDNNALIRIQNKTMKLGQILKSFIQTSQEKIAQFNDAFQLDIGEYLFNQLFSEFKDTISPTNFDLHISTSIPNMFLIPWHLLSHNRSFLSSSGWSVSLSNNSEFKPCTFPDNTKILIVASEPGGKTATNAQAHLEGLENELSSHNHTLTFGLNLDAAYTWEEFTEKLQTFSPDVIYLYAHCTENSENTKLCMASKTGKQSYDIDSNEFLTAIEKMSAMPLLVYLNCVNVSTGMINFSISLNKVIPAVITSRFLYSTDVAQEQGLKLLTEILTRGVPPHRAVATLFGKLDTPMTTAHARWITPIIFRQYDKWNAKIPETPGRQIHDPHWHLKLDRVKQFSIISAQILQMVKEGRPRCQAFVWYGTDGQGIGKFHHRLNVELREYLLNFNAHIYEVRPEWPSELDDPEIAFADSLKEAFEVNNLDDIPIAIRKMSYGASGKRALVYVRHVPVTSSRLINPKALKEYLIWWDEQFIPLLEHNQFALLGVSFIVKNPPKFRNLILKTERLEDLNLKQTVFRLLDEMEQLAYRDLVDFFKTHNIHLPIKNRDKIIERILEKTQGHYEKTVKQLQILVEQSWDFKEDEELKKPQATDDYDY